MWRKEGQDLEQETAEILTLFYGSLRASCSLDSLHSGQGYLIKLMAKLKLLY